MAQDASEWLKGCRCCHIAKTDYNEPKPKQGNLIATIHWTMHQFYQGGPFPNRQGESVGNDCCIY